METQFPRSSYNGGIKPLPSRIKTIIGLKPPTVAKDLKHFLHMKNFYRAVLQNPLKHQPPLFVRLMRGTITLF